MLAIQLCVHDDAVNRALTLACEMGQVEAAGILLDGWYMRQQKTPSQHAMWAACRSGNTEIIKMLHAAGCELATIERNICARHGIEELVFGPVHQSLAST
jgi:hypothetical protein